MSMDKNYDLSFELPFRAGMISRCASGAETQASGQNELCLRKGRIRLTAMRTSEHCWTLFVVKNDRIIWQLPSGLTLIYAKNGGELLKSTSLGYDQVTLAQDCLECRCVLGTPAGNRLEVADTYRLAEEGVHLRRRMKVLQSADSEEAFSVETLFAIAGSKTPEEYFWFAPGYWYGQGEPFFRLNQRGEAGDALDFFCAPVMLCYNDRQHLALSITELSPGRRRTVAEDRLESIPGILVSDQFFLPAMGVRKMPNGSSAFYHTFPGHTHRDEAGTLYRMLPFQENLERTIVLEFRMDDAENDQRAMVNAWRRLWAQLVDIQVFADPLEVRQTLLQYVDRSFIHQSGIAKYMKNVEYNEASSGFLFRNVDLAHLLLEAGTKQNKSGWIKHALAVIQTQLATKKIRIDENPINLRPSIEGIHSLLKCCQWAARANHDASQWLDTAIRETEPVLDMQEYFSIPLMITLHRMTGEMRYLDAARTKGNWSWNHYFSKRWFTGGITDCEPQSLDRESAILALEGYLDLYEAAADSCWLDRAVFCAEYLETMQIIQDIDMEPYGADGAALERRNQHTVVNAAVGNNLSSIGLSHITVGGSCGDIYSVYSVPDFYRLYKATGDAHYLEVARVLQYHTLQYVHMGDKAGGMADVLYHTGKGFINEFIAVGICGGYVMGRGWAHAENIGWCPYVILSGMQRMYELTGDYIL